MTNTAKLAALAEAAKAALPDAILDTKIAVGELTLIASRQKLSQLMVFLRDDPALRFTILIDICGADYPDRAERFEVVYHLLSVYKNLRVRVKTSTDSTTPVASIVDLFPAANWFKREAFDQARFGCSPACVGGRIDGFDQACLVRCCSGWLPKLLRSKPGNSTGCRGRRFELRVRRRRLYLAR
jgi:Ni,Fe-hydrogenase III component G